MKGRQKLANFDTAAQPGANHAVVKPMFSGRYAAIHYEIIAAVTAAFREDDDLPVIADRVFATLIQYSCAKAAVLWLATRNNFELMPIGINSVDLSLYIKKWLTRFGHKIVQYSILAPNWD